MFNFWHNILIANLHSHTRILYLVPKVSNFVDSSQEFATINVQFSGNTISYILIGSNSINKAFPFYPFFIFQIPNEDIV